jgi:hypothetical protein
LDSQNRKRGLSDVVGVEAWHQSFDDGPGAAALHIDVVFQTGRLGGSPQDRVRFKLGLKRASIIVVIPPGEPTRVDVRSVIRDSPSGSGQVVQTIASGRKSGAGVGLNANLGAQSNLAGSVNLEAVASDEREKNVQITEAISHMKVVHMKNDEQFHRWIVSPTITPALDGRPWDSGTPRLNLIDTRKLATQAMPPTVRVEVRCLIEDLAITDIALKDQTAWARIVAGPNHRNKVAAAEAFIRNRLYRDGLLSGSLVDEADRYAEITIAATIAES